MPKVVRTYSSAFFVVLGVASSLSFYFFLIDQSQATQVSMRSDTLNNSILSATSNHSIAFTVQDAVTGAACASPPCASNASSTLSVAFPSDFSWSTLTCGDISAATGTQFAFNVGGGNDARTNCLNTGTSWGVSIDSGNRIVQITTPTSSAAFTYIPAGTAVVINIGSNATSTPRTAPDYITNPTTAGTKTLLVGGSAGEAGNILVAIMSATGVQITAVVAETLSFTIYSLQGLYNTGVLAGRNSNTSPTSDDDDASPNMIFVTTTVTTVPFGTITSGHFYEGCQRLAISTNAANGYTISQQEDGALRTAGNAVIIPDVNCSTGSACTATTAGFWTGTDYGFGVTCKDPATSTACSRNAPNFAAAGNYVPFANQSNSISTAKFSSTTVAPWTEISVKAKYRVRISAQQAAGVFTNTVDWIATPTY